MSPTPLCSSGRLSLVCPFNPTHAFKQLSSPIQLSSAPSPESDSMEMLIGSGISYYPSSHIVLTPTTHSNLRIANWISDLPANSWKMFHNSSRHTISCLGDCRAQRPLLKLSSTFATNPIKYNNACNCKLICKCNEEKQKQNIYYINRHQQHINASLTQTFYPNFK